LGCTHYPIIKNIIQEKIGKRVVLVNSGEGIAKVLSSFLKEKKLEAPKNLNPVRKYYVTDLTKRFIKVAEIFLGEKLDGKVKKIVLD
jgi:glutamate racemase